MKKVLCIFLGLLVIFMSLYGVYRYKLKQYYKLGNINEKYIKTKVFGKDSNNKGYSDEGQKQLDEDLAVIGEDSETRIYYQLALKQERKLILSRSQDEYIANYKQWAIILDCMYKNKKNDIPFKNFGQQNGYTETPRMTELFEIVNRKYFKRLTYREKHNVINTFSTPKICQELKK